jgi:4-amino-4-deoxy-L-arabinose transferase-like glycosyltransferase
MDEIVYDSLAQNLLDGKLYAKIGGFYPPGYPIFLSIAYLISEDKSTVYYIMLTMSAIFTTSIIFPSYFMLKKYCSEAISIIGALAVTTLPIINYYSFTIMTEALFIPLFLFSAWFLLKSYETNDKKWELLASLSVVYLYITRSNGLAMLIAFVLTFIYYIIVNSNKNKILILVKKKSFFIATFIIFLISWLIISTYVTNINKPFSSSIDSHFNYGSSYNIMNIINIFLNIFTNIENLKNGIITLIYHIDYFIINSCFTR